MQDHSDYKKYGLSQPVGEGDAKPTSFQPRQALADPIKMQDTSAKGTKISAKSQQPVPQIHVDLGILCFLWGRRWRQWQQIAAQLIELRNDFLQQKLMHRRSDAPGGKEHVGATSGSPWSSLKLGLKTYPQI